MIRTINVALEISNNDLLQRLLSQIQGIDAVQVVPVAKLVTKVKPDIVIIDDNGQNSMFNVLKTLCAEVPERIVFLVSTDASPQRIVEMMKSGIAEYLMVPVDNQTLHKAIEDVRIRLTNVVDKVANGLVYSFIGSKGGLGATVIAVNTAVAMAADKKSDVDFFDMSIQSGDASVMLDVVPETTIIDICQNFHRLDVALLRGAMSKAPSGFDFLAAPLDQEDYQSVSAHHVEQIIKLSKKIYDQTIIDCTSMFIDECTVEAFKASEKVIVVTELSVLAVRNTARLIQLIRKVGIAADKIEVVVNRYIRGGVLSVADVEETVKQKVFWLFPNDFDDIVSSINQGVPLLLLHPHAPFSSNILHFVEKLKDPQSAGNYRGVRGTFGKAI
jgi:pilus assembly protein CpaE